MVTTSAYLGAAYREYQQSQNCFSKTWKRKQDGRAPKGVAWNTLYSWSSGTFSFSNLINNLLKSYFYTTQISILQNTVKFLFIKGDQKHLCKMKAADKKHLVSLATNKSEKSRLTTKWNGWSDKGKRQRSRMHLVHPDSSANASVFILSVRQIYILFWVEGKINTLR